MPLRLPLSSKIDLPPPHQPRVARFFRTSSSSFPPRSSQYDDVDDDDEDEVDDDDDDEKEEEENDDDDDNDDVVDLQTLSPSGLIEYLQRYAVNASNNASNNQSDSSSHLHEISDLLLSNVGTNLNTHQVTSAAHSLSLLRFSDPALFDAVTKAVDQDGENWYVKHAAVSDLATLMYR